jgi:hypothetical protein
MYKRNCVILVMYSLSVVRVKGDENLEISFKQLSLYVAREKTSEPSELVLPRYNIFR